MRMKKIMVCVCLLVLTACQSRQNRHESFAEQTDTVCSTDEEKEPIIVKSLPGIDAPLVMGEDTVYTNVDMPPVFSAGDLDDYLSRMVKDIHIGKGIPVIMFVVNKAGHPCHVAIRRSAAAFVPDAGSARQMDSIACEVVRDLPYFIPASLNGKLVSYRMVVAVRFR